MAPLGYADVLLRLSAAVFVGALIGFDRELRGKPAGLRTVSLVALGSAVLVLAAAGLNTAGTSDSITRVIQGIVTGIGFLGAGTIVRSQTDDSVKGLTTAASIWLAAAAGIACGLAQWTLVVIGCGLGVIVLVLDPLERWLKSRVVR